MAERVISPLRTDSRQLVSKICWCVKTFGEMMNVPKWPEPIGFFCFAPACAGRFGRMRIGGSSKNCPHSRGVSASIHLFGSGSAGLGPHRSSSRHGLWAGTELGQLAEVLGDCSEVEFVAGTARPAQP